MRRILFVLILSICLLAPSAASLPASARPAPAHLHGALAYSYATGRYGFSYDHRTQDSAINAAVDRCAAGDCKAVVWFTDGCGAFARGDRAFGWGIGGARGIAESKALAECRKHGGDCRVIEWACTTR